MPSTRQGTGFINFADFVNANRGGAERVAGALQQPYAEQVRRGTYDLKSGQEEFDRDVDAATLRYDPNRASTDDGTLRGYSYSGPSGLMDNQQFASGYGDARSADVGARRLADTYGRMGLLRETYGAKSPTYTTGQQTFDSALLGAVGQRGFESQRKDAGSLLDRFNAAQSASVGTADAARGASRAAQQQYMDAYNAPPALGGDQRRNPLPVAEPEPAPNRPQMPDTFRRINRWRGGGR